MSLDLQEMEGRAGVGRGQGSRDEGEERGASSPHRGGS